MNDSGCSIDTLKNNSRMIGNVLGAEVDFFEDKKPKHGSYFFLDKPVLEV